MRNECTIPCSSLRIYISNIYAHLLTKNEYENVSEIENECVLFLGWGKAIKLKLDISHKFQLKRLN